MSIINELNILMEADDSTKDKAIQKIKNLPPKEKEMIKRKKLPPEEKQKALNIIDKAANSMDLKKAEEHINKIDKNLGKLEGKVDNKMMDGIKKALEMVKDGITGKYPLPKRTLFMIIANILYVVSPIDILPEIFLGPIGLIDDVGVWASLYPAIAKDLAEYALWKTTGKMPNVNLGDDSSKMKSKGKKGKGKTSVKPKPKKAVVEPV